MEININSKELLDSVKVVGVCVRQKNSLPILDNLLFEISQGKLVITADNLEIRTSIEMEIKSKGDLSVCIPYKMLLDVLSSLPNSPIKMAFTENLLTISLKTGVYTIPTEDGKLFTEPAKVEDIESIKFDGGELSEALKNASMFIPLVDFEAIGNVFLQITENGSKIFGTDKNITYRHDLPISGNPKVLLLSKEVSKYISSALAKSNEVEINYSDSHIIVQLENHSISAILSQGDMPNFEKLFAYYKFDKTLKLDKEEFHSSVNRISKLSDDENKLLRLNISKSKMEIYFENQGTNFGAKEILPCEFDGEDMFIAFKSSYLLSTLNSLAGESEVVIELLSGDSPCLISTENTKLILGPYKTK